MPAIWDIWTTLFGYMLVDTAFRVTMERLMSENLIVDNQTLDHFINKYA